MKAAFLIRMLSGALLTCVFTGCHRQVTARTPAPPLHTNSIDITVTNVVRVTSAKPGVSFPPLVLAGLVVNGPKSSALINGRLLYVGDNIGDVILVAVDAEHATVALEGQTKCCPCAIDSGYAKRLARS